MFKFLFTSILFLSVILMSNFVQAETTSCLDLQSDLKLGMTNSSVTLLQEYLKNIGYLSTTATGYFGPATLAAVKVFQTNDNISPTGYVGSLTRTLINKKSCVINTTTNTVTIQPTSTPSATSNQTISTINITSPVVGQVISSGSSIAIRWDKAISGNYNIILEQPGGVGAGFIASNISNSSDNKYIWKVSSVFSSQTNQNKTIDAGTYRIRIQNTNSSSNSADILSGWFTITAQVFNITSIVPASAPADDSTAVVLFGTGFATYNNSIYFDTNYSGISATNLYVSPDGTVLVFSIPKTVTAGPHTLYINSGLNSGLRSMPFTVSTI